MDRVHPTAGLAGRGLTHVDIGVEQQEAEQLGTTVAAGTVDRSTNHATLGCRLWSWDGGSTGTGRRSIHHCLIVFTVPEAL